MSSTLSTAANPYRVQPRAAEGLPSHVIGCAICGLIGLGFWLVSADCRHWFIAPVLLCGAVLSVDAVEWARGRMDVFDPAGLIGLFGLHFFLLAPLLQVSNDFWVTTWLDIVSPPPDWRPWVGKMAVLNLGGLVVYRYVMNYFSRVDTRQIVRREWRIDHDSFPVLLGIAIAAATLAQLWVYYRFGGIVGYVTAVEEFQSEAFAGWGRVCMISESLPLLMVIGFAVYARDNPVARSWSMLTCLGVAFLVLTLLCSGLRGCRSNTVWTLFWAVGLVHFWIRPISKKIVCAGLIFLMLFMYGYGFYKWGGRDGVASLFDSRARASWVNESNRSAMRTLTFDMGRCGVQSYLLYHLLEKSDYEYAWGRTYVGTVALLIPESIWPNRPPTKRKEGTEAFFGRGSHAPGEFEVTWLYGLAGETMLNFGPLAVPFAFSALGFITGFTRRLLFTLELDDPRLLFLPFLVSICFITLAWDSNNLLVFTAKNAAFAAVIVLLAVKAHTAKVPASPPAGAWAAQTET